jgi:hypothetical protein
MVAGSHNVDSPLEQLRYQRGRHPVAARKVLAVRHHEVDRTLVAQFGQVRLQDLASGLAYNISDEEYSHER